jgi:hypothetical protein
VAVYCQHEPDKASHFGHHAHQHQAQGDDKAEKNKPGKVHNDCEICHHAVQVSMPGAAMPPVVSSNPAHAGSAIPAYLSYIAEGPQRPNWSLVA